MYSDMSSWISEFSSPKRNSARVLAVSVLPTPDGPRKMNEPLGRFGSLRPARVRRIAWDTARMASSWPMTRLWSSSSMRRSLAVSSSVSLYTGMPVQLASTSAMTSSSTTSKRSTPSARHSCSLATLRWRSSSSFSRSFLACSKFCFSIASSLSLRTRAMSSSMAL